MKLENGLVFVGKEFIKADIDFEEKINSINLNDSSIEPDCYIVPGFVDIHTHGALGGDFSDAKADDLPKMLDYYAACGVCSILPTTMTVSENEICSALKVISECDYHGGAKIAGIHIEGPFLNPKKNGAQSASNIRKPDSNLFDKFNIAANGKIKMLTLACEEEGSEEFIKYVSTKCTVSLGHSAADYNTAMKAFSDGATHVTHLFNAMNPLGHRAPAIIGAAYDSNASVELICDGIHVHPSVIRMTAQIYGDKLNLVSDSSRCSGMPDGLYLLGGQMTELKNGKATVQGTDTLAGSTISLIDAVRNLVKYGVKLESAIYAASTAPADAIKCHDIGRLEKDACADIVVLDKSLNIKSVYVDGKRTI